MRKRERKVLKAEYSHRYFKSGWEGALLLWHSDLDVNIVISVDVTVHLSNALPLQPDHLVALTTGRNLHSRKRLCGVRMYAKTRPQRWARHHCRCAHHDTDGLVQPRRLGHTAQDGLSHWDEHVWVDVQSFSPINWTLLDLRGDRSHENAALQREPLRVELNDVIEKSLKIKANLLWTWWGFPCSPQAGRASHRLQFLPENVPENYHTLEQTPQLALKLQNQFSLDSWSQNRAEQSRKEENLKPNNENLNLKVKKLWTFSPAGTGTVTVCLLLVRPEPRHSAQGVIMIDFLPPQRRQVLRIIYDPVLMDSCRGHRSVRPV